MYAKLVLRNAKRSVKDYLILHCNHDDLRHAFFIRSCLYPAATTSRIIGSEYDFTMLSDGMKMAICAVTWYFCF